MNAVHHAVISATVAAAICGGAFYAAPKLMRPVSPVVMKSSGKVMPAAWGELSQAEIDKLTSIVAKGPRRTVSIFCADKNCDDLALDFDNAFESAKWTSGIERPTIDTNSGINVGPKSVEGIALAMAIEVSVNHRFSVGLIDAKVEPGRMVVVISKKPR